MKTKTSVLVAIAIAVAMFGFSSISSAADTTYYGASLAKSFDDLAASGARQVEFSGTQFRLAPILAGMPYSASKVKCYAMYTEGNTLYVARRVGGQLLFLPYNGEPYAPYYDIVSFDGNSWTPDAFDYLGASGVSVAGKSFVFGIAPETIVTLDEFIKTFSGDWIKFVTPTASTGIANNPNTVPILWIDDSTALLPTTSSTATITAIIGENGGKTITSRGVCYALTADPNRDGTCVASTTNIGLDVFTTSLTGLASNTLYHARAYATNSVGTNYSQDVKFATLVATASDIAASLSITINSVSATETKAVVRSSITGGDDVIERGVCYATTLNPTYPGSGTAAGPSCVADTSITTTSTFNISLPSTAANTLQLARGAVYHARAYAVTSIGTTYSSDYQFKTAVIAQAGIEFINVRRFEAQKATVTALITSDSPITAAGVCYSNGGNLPNADVDLLRAIANDGTIYGAAPNQYVCTLDGVLSSGGQLRLNSSLPQGGLNLAAGTNSYVVYATNSAGTVWNAPATIPAP